MYKKITNPIFFLGAPRSGTTIIFEAFAAHEDLSWFSNYLSKHPKYPVVSLLSRLTFSNYLQGSEKQISKQSRLKNHLPYPSECYSVWESCCGTKFLFDFLKDQRADETEKQRLVKTISKVMQYHGKKRFAAKITGPSKIHYLDSIFPDAKFVHIIRDGRSVVNSLMNVNFWREGGGYHKPWWNNGLTNRDIEIYEKYQRSSLALAAVQWRRIIKIARDESEKIKNNRYCEIKYEDFMKEPHGLMQELFDFSGLDYSKKVEKYMDKRSNFKSQNYKFLESMSKNEIDMLNDIMGNLMTDLGYSII